MLRNVLIKRYVDTKDIQRVIGHSSVVHVKRAIVMIALLFVLYVIFALLHKTTPAEYRKRIFWVIGLALFAKWTIDFLNSYLDCLILSKDSLTLFLWEGLLEYKTEIDAPKKQLWKLMMLKESFLTRQKKQIEQDLSEDNERFNVLVEAMSEVVKEYMDKKT